MRIWKLHSHTPCSSPAPMRPAPALPASAGAALFVAGVLLAAACVGSGASAACLAGHSEQADSASGAAASSQVWINKCFDIAATVANRPAAAMAAMHG